VAAGWRWIFDSATRASSAILSLKPPLKEGDQPTVQWILQQPGGVNVNAGGEQNGWTALHLASLCGHAIVQAILQVDGVHVNARTVKCVKHLHIACCAAPDRLLVVQALLEEGADPNAADNDGNTPLVIVGYVDVIDALLDAGADPARDGRGGNTPLHIPCHYGQLDAVVQVLIQRQGPECLTLKNSREQTPLDRIDQNRR